MIQKENSFGGLIKSFKVNFWLASAMELLERWAWYGMFAVLPIFLTASIDEGGLGFSHTQKGFITGNVTTLLYFLPIIMGVIADRIGYKISLIISFLMMAVGYYFMGNITSYYGFYAIFAFTAIGAALFKPVASGVVARSTNDTNSKLGFGVFYMMVNIGGFIGPSMSSYLRTTYGWRLIFIQAAVVIAINLVLVLIFFREPKIEKPKTSVAVAIKESISNVISALKDVRLTVLLIIMIGFWVMFNQLFYTLPSFIEDWIDKEAMYQHIHDFSPWLANYFSGGGTAVNPEMLINIDAGAIVLFQVIISTLVTKMRFVSAMIRGFLIAIVGIGLTFYFTSPLYLIVGILIFAIGEMTTNPTFSAFIASISPKGKEALYQGTYFLPVAVGNFFTGIIAGPVYEKWSSKLTLLKEELAKRNISMPKIDEQFTQKDFYELAYQKLGMTANETTDFLWHAYNPNKITYLIVAIGLVTVLALYLYDKLVIQPREKKENLNKLK